MGHYCVKVFTTGSRVGRWYRDKQHEHAKLRRFERFGCSFEMPKVACHMFACQTWVGISKLHKRMLTFGTNVAQMKNRPKMACQHVVNLSWYELVTSYNGVTWCNMSWHELLVINTVTSKSNMKQHKSETWVGTKVKHQKWVGTSLKHQLAKLVLQKGTLRDISVSLNDTCCNKVACTIDGVNAVLSHYELLTNCTKWHLILAKNWRKMGAILQTD